MNAVIKDFTSDWVFDIETTGLHPMSSEIIAIGVKSIVNDSKYIFDRQDSSEKELLEDFNKFLSKGVRCLIGFNNDKFDTDFVVKRMLKHGVDVKPIFYMPSIDMFPLLNNSTFFKNWRNMDKWCSFLGIPISSELNGSNMPDAWANKDYDKIKEHLEDDLEKTKQMYFKIKELIV